MKRALILSIALSAINVSASHGQQQSVRIYKLEELRWPQIDALDRERTMFILPIGMLEEHGPHLPIGADRHPRVKHARSTEISRTLARGQNSRVRNVRPTSRPVMAHTRTTERLS